MDVGGRLRREPAVECNAWSSCREQLLIETCSHCGRAVKVIACIEDRRSDRSVRAGLRHDGCGGRR